MILSLSTGDFQFSVSSDDNSEFWLSSDDSPLNARLLVYVGRVSSPRSSSCSGATPRTRHPHVHKALPSAIHNVCQIWIMSYS